MATSAPTSLPTLNHDNAYAWFNRIRIALGAIDAYEIAVGRETRPELPKGDDDKDAILDATKALASWLDRGRKGLNLVTNCIDTETFTLLITPEISTIDQLWPQLTETFAAGSAMSLGRLLTEYENAAMRLDEGVLTYYGRLAALRATLKEGGEKKSDYSFAVKLVRSLNSKFKTSKTVNLALLDSEEDTTPTTVRRLLSKLREQELMLRMDEEEENKLEAAAMAAAQAATRGFKTQRHQGGDRGDETAGGEPKPFTGKCHFCDRTGHRIAECRDRKRWLKEKSSKKESSANAADANTDDKDDGDSYLFAVAESQSADAATFAAVQQPIAERRIEMLWDSGASDTMVRDAYGMFNYKTCEGRRVVLGNGAAIEVAGVGSIRLTLPPATNAQDAATVAAIPSTNAAARRPQTVITPQASNAKDGPSVFKPANSIVLHGVLHVPAITRPLLSVSHVSNAGYRVFFNQLGVRMYDDTGVVVAGGVRDGRLYKVTATVCQADAGSTAATVTRLAATTGAAFSADELPNPNAYMWHC
jgi:hypothetical protein